MPLTEVGARLSLANRRRFQQDAQDTRRDVRGIGEEVERTNRRASSSGQAWKRFGGGVAAAVGIGAAGVGAFTAQGLQALVEMERLSAQTTAAIKATGRAAGVSTKDVVDMAGAIERRTGVEAESVLAGQNMLLTFAQVQNRVGKGNDIFNQATKTLIDMSVATGVDAKTAAVGLGKALNDPVKGLTALSKQGVTFTKQQAEQVKAMMAVGDIAGAQKLILGELAANYGGSAEAFGDTTAGKIERAKAAYGDLQETVATLLMPALERTSTWLSDEGVPALDRFGAWFSGPGGDGIKRFAGDTLAVAKTALDAVSAGFGWARRNADWLAPVIAGLLGGFLAWRAVTGVIRAITAAQAAWNAVMLMNPIGLVVIAVAAFVAAIVIAYRRSETFRTVVQKAFDGLKIGAAFAVGAIVKAFRGLLTVWLGVAGGILTGAEKALGWVPGIGDKLKGASDAFDRMKDNILGSLDQAANKAFDYGKETAANLARGAAAGPPVEFRAIMAESAAVQAARSRSASGIGGRQVVEARAAGGPVRAGRPYVVGEFRPELFVPSVDGMVLPSVPTVRGAGLPSVPAPTSRTLPEGQMAVGGDGAALGGLHLVVELDGRVLAEAALDQFEGPLRVRLADAVEDGGYARQSRT